MKIKWNNSPNISLDIINTSFLLLIYFIKKKFFSKFKIWIVTYQKYEYFSNFSFSIKIIFGNKCICTTADKIMKFKWIKIVLKKVCYYLTLPGTKYLCYKNIKIDWFTPVFTNQFTWKWVKVFLRVYSMNQKLVLCAIVAFEN